jgi:nucleotide-binding universal stress UspA family protein
METADIKPIVVGFDCSPAASLALEWAVEEAHSIGAPLRVVVARGDLYTLSHWADDWTRGLAEEWAGRARKRLADLGVEDAEVVVRDGLPAEALIRESAEAGLVVVGSQGHSPVMEIFQGSVSQHVSRHAACPVVVVRGVEDKASRRVVVGVDGSGASLAALEYALGFAVRHDFGVTVLFCPDRWKGYGDAELVPELIAEFEARERLVRESVLETGRRAGVEVDVEEVPSRPAHALIAGSRSAALVVVGSRGRGAFAGMVLGSVGAEVLRHAHCPVTVVRCGIITPLGTSDTRSGTFDLCAAHRWGVQMGV